MLTPSSVRARYFYSYSSAWSPVNALTEGTVAPAVPNRYRKLYSSNSSGTAELHFPDPKRSEGAGVVISAYLGGPATRCPRLRVLDSARTVLAEGVPEFGTSGWVSVRVRAVSPVRNWPV